MDWRLSSLQDAAASLRKVLPGWGSCADGRTGSGSGRNRRGHIPSDPASKVLKPGIVPRPLSMCFWCLDFIGRELQVPSRHRKV